MTGGHIGIVLRRLRGLLGAECAGGPTDGELLRRYVVARDDSAFEALLRRHGPMVLGVCRRLLGCAQDVDDAFQATFLILIRRASAIEHGDRVANWLYGVAYRVAVRARVQAAKRRDRQQPLTDVARDDAPKPGVEEAVRVLLDEEVNRLPARYREAIVCCYLEGRTQEETARLLGWPKGTVATRLNRARELLRNRLTRRGLLFTAGTLTALLPPGSAEAALPPALVNAVMQTTAHVLAGGVAPPGAAVLVQAVLRAGLFKGVNLFVGGALSVAMAAGGAMIGFGGGEPYGGSKSANPVAEVRPIWSAGPRKPGPSALPSNADPIPVVQVEVDGNSVRIGRDYRAVCQCDGGVPAAHPVPPRDTGTVVTIALSPNGASATVYAQDSSLCGWVMTSQGRVSFKVTACRSVPPEGAQAARGGGDTGKPARFMCFSATVWFDT
jgi:RNA polymerase sigma factor (sigma-70 family)